MKRRAVVIAYDISSNKRRRRVFRCLQAWQLDSQYSLFECLLTQREAEELFLQLTDMIDESEDSLLLAWLDGHQQPRAVTPKTRLGFQQPVWYQG